MTIKKVTTQWQYLEKRPHPWQQQLCFKGRRLKAFDVWSDMIVNDMTPQEAALNWELPMAAIEEAIEYCQMHQDLLRREAEEERRRLEAKGISLEPKIITR